MTELLQAGTFARAATAVTPQQAVLAPPQWRYLWLLADVANQAPLNVWIGSPPGNRAPDFTLSPGQQRAQDNGRIATSSWWISSADGSAWAANYEMDVEAIGVDANVVGATTPLQPARVIGTYQTTNNLGAVDGPYKLPAGCQSIMLLYPAASSGMGAALGIGAPTFLSGDQSGAEVDLVPAPAAAGVIFSARQAFGIFPAGAADTSFHVHHTEVDAAPQTVQVVAVFTPVEKSFSVVAAVTPNPLPVAQSGAWTVTTQDSGAQNMLSTSFSRLTAAVTTVIPSPGIQRLKVWGYRLSLRPPAAGVNDGSVALKAHTAGTVFDVIEYNQDSAVALGSQHTSIALPGPLVLATGDAFDVDVAADAGGFSVSGAIFYQVGF